MCSLLLGRKYREETLGPRSLKAADKVNCFRYGGPGPTNLKGLVDRSKAPWMIKKFSLWTAAVACTQEHLSLLTAHPVRRFQAYFATPP